MKVAIVHDWLNQMGGAEGVLEALHDLYPEAPVYTSIYTPDRMPAGYCAWDIRTTFMQRLPGIAAHHQAYLPFYPLAFGATDLTAYDLVISNASAFCKGVRTRPGAHLCYCLTPTRFLWMYREYVQREGLGRLPRAVLPPVIGLLRAWDRRAADRVTAFAAISRAVQDRIRRFYGRDSTIIYPPVPESAFAPLASAPRDEGYYLSLGRLIPYKRVDLAVRAFNRLGLPLVIIGDGRDRAALQSLASPNVRFVGRVSDDDKRHWLAGCRAFVFPGEEDFGIAPIEAQAAGKPVIAYAAGGALDTIQEGVTGAYFREPTAESLADAVTRFDPAAYDPAACLANARRFDTASFNAGWQAFVAANLH